MYNLFKNLLNKTQCQRNGICSTNPVINAIEVVIINEIRQIAFYIVKLHEINYTNLELIKQTVFSLSVNISDIDFNKASLLNFFKNLKEIRKNAQSFYIKKASEMKLSYEVINPVFNEENEDVDLTSLIKSGENIVHNFYNTIKEEKLRLINILILICRVTSVKIIELSNYKEVNESYYFEILRLLSLTNHKTTREEKFKRRIKEFSNIIYDVQNELNFELEKAYGKRENGRSNTNIYEGRSILISGGDLDELYNLLEKTKDEDINIYINPTMISSIFYPKFHEYKNFKGIYGTNEIEFDFSKFKGPIYTTRNSTRALDSAIRGSIYTTKLIQKDKTVKIDKNNLSPLIEEAKKLEGFDSFIKGTDINFEYNLKKVKEIIELNKGKNFLIHLGPKEKRAEEVFKDYTIIEFIYPYETEGLYFAMNEINNENLSVYFSECAPENVNTIISIINKKLSKIYLSNCMVSSINPHITESLKKDFNIQII